MGVSIPILTIHTPFLLGFPPYFQTKSDGGFDGFGSSQRRNPHHGSPPGVKMGPVDRHFDGFCHWKISKDYDVGCLVSLAWQNGW